MKLLIIHQRDANANVPLNTNPRVIQLTCPSFKVEIAEVSISIWKTRGSSAEGCLDPLVGIVEISIKVQKSFVSWVRALFAFFVHFFSGLRTESLYGFTVEIVSERRIRIRIISAIDGNLSRRSKTCNERQIKELTLATKYAKTSPRNQSTETNLHSVTFGLGDPPTRQRWVAEAP